MLAGDFEVHAEGVTGPLTFAPTDEESAIHPSSVYGITKHTQEQLVMTVCPTIGIAPVALRYQNVYGPGQSLSNPYTGILSIFSSLILAGQAIKIFEDGLESRDFVFIDDVVDATFRAITSDAANDRILNVGSGVPTTVNEVVEALFDAFGRRVDVERTGNFRLGDIRHNFADLTRIHDLLGFSAAVDFASGVRRLVEWVLRQPIAGGGYEASLAEMRDRGLLQ